jgi:YfiH family protein
MNTRVAVIEGAEVPVLVSPVLDGFAHGFPTRAGGVSQPPYQSLNFSRGWGDTAEAVAENRRRWLQACGLERLFVVKQVHGAQVARVGPDDAPERWSGVIGDALITDRPGAALGVFTADCVPLLLADASTGACGAVHAGWRGVIAGVGAATIAALSTSFGSRPQSLRIAMGPAIGPCCFEVGSEVVAAFEARYRDARDRGVIREGPRRPHVDLKRALRLDLEAVGVPADQIDAIAACTRCDPDNRFFSYRRDNGRTGQHLAVIGFPAPAVPPPSP